MTRPTAPAVPRLVRGSVIVHHRRCGGRRCHCADGALHASTVLSDSERGRTHFLMLPPVWIAPVPGATDRYRRRRRELEVQASGGLAALVATVPSRQGRA